ncbi:hypothetical protein [Bradyrhizobium sp. HKCCYLRH3083]|uniref:hypothetical protein n=1 Tax=unclassified Bradyrhizobium TaxID=2631580 RepID=UPI003EBC12A4
MTEFDSIKDPIIRIYALDLLKHFRSALSYGYAVVLDDARKSLNRSQRVPAQIQRRGREKNYEIAQLYRAFHAIEPATPDKELEVLSRILGELNTISDFFLSTRSYFTRYTNIDERLANYQADIASLDKEMETLRSAVNGSEDAKKEIYHSVMRERFDQLDAPYLFEIVDFVIELTNPPPFDNPPNATEGLAALVKQAHELAKTLTQTNVDRRFVSAIHDYIDALTEEHFSPIKIDLISNRLRFHLVEMRDEIPGFAIAEVSALLLSQERVLRQFPMWRAFEAEASKFDPNEEITTKQTELLSQVASETRNSTGIASDRVIEAFDRLIETNDDISSNKTAEFGVWRSVENFLKTNIRHVINAAKSIQKNATQHQIKYMTYIERLLPAAKLYASMDSSKAWLLPVILWIEDTIKQLKR